MNDSFDLRALRPIGDDDRLYFTDYEVPFRIRLPYPLFAPSLPEATDEAATILRRIIVKGAQAFELNVSFLSPLDVFLTPVEPAEPEAQENAVTAAADARPVPASQPEDIDPALFDALGARMLA